jgi:hypothetical protein
MAIFTVGPNSRMYWDQYDFTGDLKDGSFTVNTEALDKTAWGDTTRVSRAGLHSVSISASGHQSHDTGEVGTVLSSELTTSDSIIAIGANVSSEGDIMYVANSAMSSYVPIQGAVGDQAAFGVEAMSSGAWFRGRLMADKSARTSTGTSTGIQLGTIAASKNMHASLHVFSVSGTNPTLDVTIESDDNGSYTSALTRMTFTQATAAGAQFIGPTAGPAGSDDYWRVAWTIGGTDTPTFNFAVVFGFGWHG